MRRKADPVELGRAGIIAAGALLYLSDLDARQARELADLAAANAAKALGLAAQRASRLLDAATQANYTALWAEARNVIDHELKWQLEHHISHCTLNTLGSTGTL